MNNWMHHGGSDIGRRWVAILVAVMLGLAGVALPVAPASASSPPGAPEILEIVGGDRTAVVSWNPPSSDGGSAITSYEVTERRGRACSTTGATQCTFTDIPPGVGTFQVRAVNGAGPGPWSPEVSAWVDGLPKPVNVRAEAADASAVVSWEADGNGNDVEYLVQSNPEGKTCHSGQRGRFSCTVDGLTNGISYTFVVMADTWEALGPVSEPSNPVVPVGVPTAPRSVTAAVRNASAEVSWAAPLSDGGSPITLTTVTATPGGATCSSAGDWPNRCTVEGLRNGASYTFTATAQNADGEVGLPSDPTDPVVPSPRPTPPRNVVVSPRNGSVSVSWLAPEYDGGSAIATYVATAAPGGASCTTDTTGCTVTGLVNGTRYTFTVRATNGASDVSLPSEESGPVVPVGPAQPPTSVTAVAGDRSAVVSWRAPASDGGSSITGYVATATPGGRACSATATSCTVTGLTNGTEYTFTVVVSTQRGGISAPSLPSSPVTPGAVTPPSAPRRVTAVAGNGAARVSWTAPESDGGAPVTGYTVTSSPGAKQCTTTSSTACQVTGLSNGRVYSFLVTATNAAGTGAASAPSNAVVPRAAIRVLAARGAAGNVLRVNVDPDRGAASYAFRVQRRSAAGTWSLLPTRYRTQGAAETASIVLPPGTYRVWVPAAGAFDHGFSRAVVLIPPAARVTVGADAPRNRLWVDVDPDRGSGHWAFRVQKRTVNGSWTTLQGTYTTQGARETRSLNLTKGTYRVIVAPSGGYRGATSGPVTLVR